MKLIVEEKKFQASEAVDFARANAAKWRSWNSEIPLFLRDPP